MIMHARRCLVCMHHGALWNNAVRKLSVCVRACWHDADAKLALSVCMHAVITQIRHLSLAVMAQIRNFLPVFLLTVMM